MAESNINYDAYTAGAMAYDHGIELDDCPHRSEGGFNKLRQSWMVGWLDWWSELKYGLERRKFVDR